MCRQSRIELGASLLLLEQQDQESGAAARIRLVAPFCCDVR
jgi:hypothetical protein